MRFNQYACCFTPGDIQHKFVPIVISKDAYTFFSRHISSVYHFPSG